MQLYLPFSQFKKVYISIAILLLAILSGTVGYMVIEHYTFLEAIYMTVLILSTVGFAEVKPLDEAGRIFTTILMLVNLGTYAYIFAQLSTYFLDGEFIRTYKLYKMKNAISELEGHVILCGFGRNGREAAKIFHTAKKNFVVIEKSPMSKEDMPVEVHYILQADATRDETLLEAGINKASALITTIADDADNLFVVLTARALNHKIKIISRATNDSTVKKLMTAGANNVIMPDKIGGAHMATLVLSPDVKEFVDLMATHTGGGFEITEVVSARTITLEELNCWFETGATILGLKTSVGDYVLNPVAKTVIQPGHRVIAMGSRDQLAKLKRLMV